MKICIFCNQFYPLIGGAERQAQLLAKKLLERGHEVFVLTARTNPELPLKEFAEEIPVFRYRYSFFGGRFKGGRLTSFIWVISIIYNLVKMKNEYDIIHTHIASREAVLCAIIGRFLGKSTIVKIANMQEASELLKLKNNIQSYSKLFLKLIFFFNYFICTNRAMVNELKTTYSIPESKIKLIPNGVDTLQFKAAEKKSNRYQTNNLSEVPKVWNILVIARFKKAKNLEILLPAAEELQKKGTHVKFTICGEGPLYTEFSQEISERKLGDIFFLHGNVEHDKVHEFLASSDIFVLPSIVEGLSNALLEAMSSGVACICSNIAANIELVSPDYNYVDPIPFSEFREVENGLLFEPHDYIGLSGALKFYIEHDDVRITKAVNANKYIVKNYSIDSVIEKYEKLYSGLMSDK